MVVVIFGLIGVYSEKTFHLFLYIQEGLHLRTVFNKGHLMFMLDSLGGDRPQLLELAA